MAAASAAYLTVSEIFAREMRAVAVSLSYPMGTSAGGFVGPALLGVLIATAAATPCSRATSVGSVLMLLAAAIAVMYGVAAERKPLEAVAPPLGTVDD